MIPAAPRTVAIALLRFAIWIAPHDTHDWGHAMLNELHHVEGNWSALIWALGGAGVLAKHAMLALILPRKPAPHRLDRQRTFRKGRSHAQIRSRRDCHVRRCLSPLLFLAPVFRQAFAVSLRNGQRHPHVKSRIQVRESIQDWTRSREGRTKSGRRRARVRSRLAIRWKRRGCAWPTKLCASIQRLTWIYGNGCRNLTLRFFRLMIIACPPQQWDPQNALALFHRR